MLKHAWQCAKTRLAMPSKPMDMIPNKMILTMDCFEMRGRRILRCV
jgi:hypothetical protein